MILNNSVRIFIGYQIKVHYQRINNTLNQFLNIEEPFEIFTDSSSMMYSRMNGVILQNPNTAYNGGVIVLMVCQRIKPSLVIISFKNKFQQRTNDTNTLNNIE